MTDKPELDMDAIDTPTLLREARKRAAYYQTGEGPLLDVAANEVERLRRWKAEVLSVIAGLQELGKTLDIPLGTSITGTEAAERAEALVAERDVLKAQVEAVEFTLNGWADGQIDDPYEALVRAVDGGSE